MVKVNNKSALILLILVSGFFLFIRSAYAVDPWLQWQTLESEHLYVHYAAEDKNLAEKVLSMTELVHQRLSEELDWQPLEKTHVILSDETDEANGFAMPFFFNRTVIYLAPPTTINTLEDFDDWLLTLITHEYTHIIHLDKSSGSPEYLRNIFGRFFLLFPNLYQPAWVTEGLASHKETNLERGVGRGQSTFFASMMREEVRNGVQPVSHVNLPVDTWPAGTTRYLYGVYFMRFISDTYGEEKLQRWIDNYSNNLFPFFINTNASQVFDKDINELWQEFTLWLQARFKPQIEAIERKGLVSGTSVINDFYNTSAIRADGAHIFYIRNNAYERAALMRYDGETVPEKLADVNQAADIDLHPERGILLTQNEYCNEYTVYRDIYFYDEKAGELVRKTTCARYLYAAWSDNGENIIAVQHRAGEFELHRLDQDAKLVEVLWHGNDGEILSKIDVSPDGTKIISSVWRRQTGWNLELFDLQAGQWQPLTEDPRINNARIKAYPQYSSAREITFSMEDEYAYNLYRYDMGSGEITQLSNVTGSALESVQVGQGENRKIYYVGYDAEGTSIYRLDMKQTALVNQDAGEKHLPDIRFIPQLQTASKNSNSYSYSPWRSLRPQWWFPVFGFSEQRSEFGLMTAGFDALAIHNYSLSVSYDFKLDEPAASFVYSFSKHFFLSLQRNNEIFLDTQGEFNRLRAHDRARVELAFPDTYILHRSNLRAFVSYDVSRDKQLKANAGALADAKDNVLGIAWTYDSSGHYPLSISANDGFRLRLVAEDSDALSSDFSGQAYTLDIKSFIRTGRESVLSLRFVQGWGTDMPQAFTLGGEIASSNALDLVFSYQGSEGIDRRDYQLRGYDEGLPQLRGRRMQLFSGEWSFPLQRPETGIMVPPVGLMQWFGSVFTEVGSAYQDSPDTYYSSVGAELKADVNLFYAVTLRLRLGYAYGFDSDIGGDRLYLSAGSQF